MSGRHRLVRDHPVYAAVAAVVGAGLVAATVAGVVDVTTSDPPPPRPNGAIDYGLADGNGHPPRPRRHQPTQERC